MILRQERGRALKWMEKYEVFVFNSQAVHYELDMSTIQAHFHWMQFATLFSIDAIL
jgi:hypothetical protein